jgi:hypothetical protein
MNHQKLVHVFRRPRYPVLCSVPGDLIAAFSLRQLERRLSRVNTAADDVLDMIDATGEGWAVHTQLGTVSPLTLHKNWRKAELLDLYRDSATRRQAGVPCEDKALMRRRLDELVLVIAAALRGGPNKPAAADTGRAAEQTTRAGWEPHG